MRMVSLKPLAQSQRKTVLVLPQKRTVSTSNKFKGGKRFFQPRWRKIEQMILSYEEGFFDYEKTSSQYVVVAKQMMQFNHPLADTATPMNVIEGDYDRMKRKYYDHFPLEDPSQMKRVMPDEDGFFKTAVDRFITRWKALMKTGLSEDDAFDACVEEKFWCDDAVALETHLLSLQSSVLQRKETGQSTELAEDEEKFDFMPENLPVEENVQSFISRVFLERMVEDTAALESKTGYIQKIRLKDIFGVIEPEHVVNFIADNPQVGEYFDEDIFFEYPENTLEALSSVEDPEELIVRLDKARKMETEVG
eukprot:TRINITY_DN792_c0_g2_i2.p1 TRINITY_DN792_c0_g2~~TRINITY_DN792_c0_g2_i2.p1  ORF type:complete len:307 (-),score=92.82 TRINITY_DN792_c0_g2_i2:527-1447(-)